MHTETHQPETGQQGRMWIPEVFGENVFTLKRMRERLPKDVYKALAETIRNESTLDGSIADMVANAMKDWAVENGATHYCHWFHPLTGLTAEKHDSFIAPDKEGGILLEFSGKDLIKGEPDASSFPSGSLREGFEARGYTVWDCTSPVFIKEDGANKTLFIPSAFCSYTGRALDYKTPVLRSREALSTQAIRVLRALGNKTSKRVTPTLGAEQEYFLVDRKMFEKRLDLMQANRTVFGLPNPKGMAMSVHYFGTVHERVASFMSELNRELWRLGVSAKTQHNEISPCQYEIAPVFETINVACDHNQLMMQTLQKVAERHDLECLLHEKPFAHLGGSGKHINWSIATDDGINLLEPGKTPHDNEVFLIFLCAVIKAVDLYAPLLRAAVSSAGNDHRMGAMEAPPAIMSIFVGSQLEDILNQLARGRAKKSQQASPIRLGVSTLPPLPKDVTDRNRTSPFAFTGNKFEFRAPGSALSISRPGFVLTTIVADVLKGIADELEKASNVNQAAQKLLQRIMKDHHRVVFNGDNYSKAWVKEAEKRGLPNLPDTVAALDAITDTECIQVFSRHNVLRRDEYLSRVETALQHYAQALMIEASTMERMGSNQILPAAIEYSGQIASAIDSIESVGGHAESHRKTLTRVCQEIESLTKGLETLRTAMTKVERIGAAQKRATAARDTLLPIMKEVRAAGDALEGLIDAERWPLPTCAEMVFKR